MENIIAIRERSTEAANEAFRHLMRITEVEINERAKKDIRTYKECNAFQLEKLSEAVLKDVCPQTPFRPEQITLVSGHTFPDIIAERYYGVEVKSTAQDQWKSTGSSIVESTRPKDVENIYMLFGKLGGSVAEFKCKPYQDVLYDIAVTHSPRYLIDMDCTTSIFDKMHTTYDQLRKSENTIERVRNYYRDQAIRENRAEMPWWLETPTNMSIRLWKDGRGTYEAENNKLAAKMFILFPEVIKSDYKRAAMWLCTRYSVLLYNARDTFTAGGQFKRIKGGGKLPFNVPHIVGEILEYTEEIKFLFKNPALILPEVKELNPNILKNGEKEMFKTWLTQTNTTIQNLKVSAVGQQHSVLNSGGIPFIDWFNSNTRLSI